MFLRKLSILVTLTGLVLLPVGAAETSPAERGRTALLEHSFNPAVWSPAAYTNAWKRWDNTPAAPADYDAAFRDHYGLHPAPYPNHGLPMGLREGPRLFAKGISSDCLICHGGSIAGQSIIGLGNASLDIHALFEDLTAADGIPRKLPFQFTNVRGTSEAGGMAVYLLGLRQPDLTLRRQRLELDLHDDLCEDPPAWWLLKKKKTMYYSGGADARSVRSIMQFMMTPLNSREAFEKAEPEFVDIQQFLLSVEPPKYPLPIDHERARAGEQVFLDNCARCHGTYGPNPTYPNKIVPLDEIGTDRRRFEGITPKFAHYYNESWFAQPELGGRGPAHPANDNDGYQAPPLDGLWATAPYFHNGSAPTVYHVLNSQARPKRFTRSYRTGLDDYDPTKLGWKVTECGPADPTWPAIERRKVYDTTLSGRGNGGHKYGDKLSESERMAVIEYLKTL